MITLTVYQLLMLSLLVMGSPSWRNRGAGHRYAPPFPHFYQMLGEENPQNFYDQRINTNPGLTRTSEMFVNPDEDEMTDDNKEGEEEEVMDPRSRWQGEDEEQEYPNRQYKKMIQPVRFNEARMRPASPRFTSGGIEPASKKIEKPSGTAASPSQTNDESMKKNQDAIEGLWMKKKKKRSRSITMKKREGRLSAEEQQKLLGELGNILKDDDNVERKKSTTKQKTAFTTNVKRQVNDTSVSEGDLSNNLEKPSEHQKFEDWLKQEYLRNMALSFATAKKKKRSPSGVAQVYNHYHQQTRDESRKKRKAAASDNYDESRTSGLDREFFDPETLDAVKERLKLIENAVLADAIQKIIVRARDDAVSDANNNGGTAANQKISNRLAEAYYIEKLKQTLDKLPQSWGNFRGEDDQQEEMDATNQWLRKRGNMNLAEALSGMGKTDDKRGPYDPDQDESIEEEEFEVCPELQLLTSDCSALEGFLPNSPMSSTLRHYCNKHEVCYTCGEAFGLTSSDCDGLFLRDTMALCRASGLCHGDGDVLLQPLHERRVFYKRSVPPICYRTPCVQAFLLEQ